MSTKINVKMGLETYMKMLYAPLHYNSDQRFSRETKRRSFLSNNQNVSFVTLYGGQFTFSTQLMILNYSVILFHRRSTTVSLES